MPSLTSMACRQSSLFLNSYIVSRYNWRDAGRVISFTLYQHADPVAFDLPMPAVSCLELIPQPQATDR
jgi:hypothetical protein